ncbi:peroxiredoxin [Pelagibacterium xiamenense]|uniref:peroxiredoxin n=1 Tax=Pelagibacterium xiamenense TaxID=2901140 RepID=UPI001E46A602|nr:peroxiredoxin [Pelagibacterium xiamenense]MCD7059253.1 peroxiredoxin [Pelagibacterium xiamenense]
MAIAPGQPIPAISVKHVTEAGVADASTTDILGTGTVVMFTVPGAFTPTCHANHLPGYLLTAEDFKAAGVDKIVCATANDHHVVRAWAEATESLGRIDFIADGLAEFAKATGLDRDLTAGGLGTRFGRHALIIVDGVVHTVNTESAPGEVVESGAPAMLDALKAL